MTSRTAASSIRLNSAGAELAGGQPLARGEQLGRAQQAADVIGVGGDHAPRIRAPLAPIRALAA